MKIEWLNDDMTEARLTRGLLRRRVAYVNRVDFRWRYVSGDSVEDKFACEIDLAHARDSIRAAKFLAEHRNWHQPRPAPRARLLAVKR